MTSFLRLATAALLAFFIVGVAPGCGSDQAVGPAPSTGAAGSGSGGAPGTGGAGGAPAHPALACPDSGGPVDPTAMIDDMEAGGYALPKEGGRDGSWWSGGDAVSPGASIDPNGNVASELIPNGGRCGSLHAKHITGQGFTSWAVLTASLRYGPSDGGAYAVQPYDAHTRTGLTFWARIGTTSGNQVRLAVSDKYSRPEGGICDPNASTSATACYDTFGVDLAPLSTTWTQYRIPFAGLGQRNFGLQQPAVDTSALYTIDFNPYPNEIFDFWVDDIAFY